MWVDEIHNVHSSAKVKLGFSSLQQQLITSSWYVAVFFLLLNSMVGQYSDVASTTAILIGFLFAQINLIAKLFEIQKRG